MRIGEREGRGSGEAIPRFTLRYRLVVFRLKVARAPRATPYGLACLPNIFL
jgi:hypothetical protein